jgi:hypothetical protein
MLGPSDSKRIVKLTLLALKRVELAVSHLVIDRKGRNASKAIVLLLLSRQSQPSCYLSQFQPYLTWASPLLMTGDNSYQKAANIHYNDREGQGNLELPYIEKANLDL